MRIIRISLLFISLMTMNYLCAQENVEMSADEIMNSVFDNLKMEKYIYEEISAILTDQVGHRDTRQLRKYTRISDDVIKFMLVFDEPEEYEGVAILVEQNMHSVPDVYLYLPANGELLKHISLWNDNEGLFGMDFTLSQISSIINIQYQYVRRGDRKIGNTNYFVVDAYEMGAGLDNAFPLMTHYVMQDGLFITRTNFYNKNGIVVKQLSTHNLDINSVDRWNAAMLYMVDRSKVHSTLIKINKRVISNSIVSDDIFTADWLFSNKPPLDMSPTEEEQLESELIDASINNFERSIVRIQSEGGR